jgi:hypothetical protein
LLYTLSKAAFYAELLTINFQPPGELSPAPAFLMMDACFGMRHRRQDDALPAKSTGFFVDAVDDDQAAVAADEGACPGFKAGTWSEAAMPANSRHKFDVFGLFAGICRHGAVLQLQDLTTPGERYAIEKTDDCMLVVIIL